MLVVGTDSHTTTYGALGAAGTGIGITEMAYVMATGKLWFRVPSTIRFDLSGTPESDCVMSKDVLLYLAGRFGIEVAHYRAIEFAGTYAESLDLAGRMAMANMGVELGAKFAFFAADAVALRYLEEVSGADAAPLAPDTDAEYEAIHGVEVGGIEPQVACPHTPGNAKPVGEAAGIEVQQAYLGSCTNGRLPDLAMAASLLRGRKVNPRTRLLVTPASRRVYLEALRRGYIEVLAEAGATIAAPGCGACYGAHGGVLAPGETCISSTNRNFRGRMGSDRAMVYLGSPATVAASAIAGRIADPREYLETSGGRRGGE
jgi:homoaconitate hydratase family protein